MLNGDEMKMAQRLIELAKKVAVFLDDYNAGLYD